MGEPSRSPRVVLHVGVPKSGTSFLQSSLRTHREVLARRGVLVPQGPREVMFRAALDVRGNHAQWGRDREDVAGVWEDLCRRAGAHPGTTVLSHELLAAATADQAAVALEVLRRHAPQHRLDLVVTTRDLARQVVAEWQENLKGGDRRDFATFWDRVERALRHDDHGVRFWAAQDVPDVVARWGGGLSPDRVHVVPCPPPGAPATTLWHRFAEAGGLPLLDLAPDVGESNTGLGTVEAALLRTVNRALDGGLAHPTYGRAVKGALVRGVLANRSSTPTRLPESCLPLVTEAAHTWVRRIREAGWQVHGTLEDLLPAGGAPRSPDDVPDGALAAAGAEVVAELLVALEDVQQRLDLATRVTPATPTRRGRLSMRPRAGRVPSR